MYQRIMVAVDENFMADPVMDAAIGLARATGAQIAICHALDETLLTKLTEWDVAALLPDSAAREEARLRLGAQGFLGRLLGEARAAGVAAEIKLLESDTRHVAEMLIDAALEWQADLIVAGTHARHGIDRYFAGSVAERLLRKGQTSLLLVRGEDPDE